MSRTFTAVDASYHLHPQADISADLRTVQGGTHSWLNIQLDGSIVAACITVHGTVEQLYAIALAVERAARAHQMIADGVDPADAERVLDGLSDTIIPLGESAHRISLANLNDLAAAEAHDAARRHPGKYGEAFELTERYPGLREAYDNLAPF
jgi:malonyl CoA-acyl carrier protein transacylase